MPVPGGKRWVIWFFGVCRVLMFVIPIVLPINHSPAFWLPFCGYNCSVWMEGFGYGNEPLVSGFIGEMYIMTKSSVCCPRKGGRCETNIDQKWVKMCIGAEK